jgi:hypothetical protein
MLQQRVIESFMLIIAMSAGEIVIAQDRSLTVAEIADAWNAREKSVRAIHLKWSSTLYSYLTPESTYSASGELALEAGAEREKFRYAVTSLIGESDGNGGRRLKVQPSLYLFDGTRSVLHFVDQPDYDKAFIGGFGEGIGRDLQIVPLRLFYRPFDENMGEFPGALSGEVEGSAEWDGEECVILSIGRRTIWVTSDKRMLPVRLISRKREPDLRFYEVRIAYETDDRGEWYPKGWSIVRFGVDGTTIIESREARVESCVINRNLDDGMFVNNGFPHGTWVRDHLSDTTYIVRDGRQRRAVLPGEFTGDNYEQLLNSEPPDLRAESGGGLAWFWFGNGLLVAFIAGVWYWKRRASQTNDLDMKGTA